MAANAPLVLGGIVFEGFEIPSSLKFPMKQRHHVHKLVGGGRVVDKLGPDPEDHKWSGRFRGATAESRCRSIEALCASGAEVGLSWGSFFRIGIVSHFDPDYNAAFEIPYSITFTPTEAGAGGGGLFGMLASSLALIMAGDIGAVINLASTHAQAAAGEAAALGQTVDTVSTFDGLPATTIATIREGAGRLTRATDDALATISTGIGAVDLAAPASAPADFGAALVREGNHVTA
jgi:hypothetical protein